MGRLTWPASAGNAWRNWAGKQRWDNLGVADEYRLHPEIGPFHPIQHYYAGTLGRQVCEISEPGHRCRLISLEQALNGLYLLPQRWAVERFLERQDAEK